MRRRKILAVVGSMGVATLAGCGGGSGEGESNGSGSGCVPETDDLSSLLPDEAGEFTLQRTAESGLDIGTDTYVVARYAGPDGDENDIIIARYSGSSAAQQGLQTIRGESTKPVTGTLVDGSVVVAVDARSQSKTRSLLQATEISCADQLSFDSGGNDSTSTTTAQQFELGTVVWERRDGNRAGTRAVDATGITTEKPSSYTASVAYPPAFTEKAVIYGNQIHEKRTGEPVRQLPAEATNTPSVVGSTAYFVTPSELVAADLATGEEVWRYTLREDGFQVVATKDVVVVELPKTIVAVSANGGSELWSTSYARRISSIFAVSDGRLYAGETVYNITDGSEVSFSPNTDFVSQLGPDGSVYIWNQPAGTLTKYTSGGSEEWSTDGTGTAWAVDTAHAYTVDGDIIRAINTGDGSEQWSFQVPQTIRHPHSIAVGSERLYAATGGRLFALNKTSGEREAAYPIDIDAPTGVVPTVGGNVVSLSPVSNDVANPTTKILVDES